MSKKGVVRTCRSSMINSHASPSDEAAKYSIHRQSVDLIIQAIRRQTREGERKGGCYRIDPFVMPQGSPVDDEKIPARREGPSETFSQILKIGERFKLYCETDTHWCFAVFNAVSHGCRWACTGPCSPSASASSPLQPLAATRRDYSEKVEHSAHETGFDGHEKSLPTMSRQYCAPPTKEPR